MSLTDKNTNLQELKDLVRAFRKERDWDKHFTPKNVATSIAIEAAELLELFQWDLLMENDKQQWADELADVIVFCLQFADVTDIDISSAVKDKVRRASEKYPVEVFAGKQDTAKTYHEIKKRYRQKGS